MKSHLIKITVLLMICSVITKNINGQKKVFVPDDNFEKELMALGIDTEKPPLVNDTVIISETIPIKSLYLYYHAIIGTQIKDLTGIEAFTELEELTITGQKVEKINLTKNTKIKRLDFSYNFNDIQIKLDLSQLSSLEELICVYMSNMDTIEFPALSKLIYIDIGLSQIRNINFTQHPNLKGISCPVCGFGKIDISKNLLLETLNCSSNSLDSLDISNNLLVTELYCSGNNIKYLDLSKNTKIRSLDVSNNNMSSIDISYNLNLNFLSVSNNLIRHIDILKNIELNSLNVNNNLLRELDVSNNLLLTHITCDNNDIKILDLGHNFRLSSLSCRKTNLNCLNLKNGNNNKISHLYLTGNSNLSCIQTDYATITPKVTLEKDSQMFFSKTCPCASGMYCMTQTNNQTITSCSSYISPSGKYKWTTSGTYLDTLKNNHGCDSIIMTNLKVYYPFKPPVNISGDTLKSVNLFKTYQWYNDDGIIPGATQSKYVINKSGKYYLVITDDNGCTNTSEVINAIHSDVNADLYVDLKYSIIPNPNTGQFTLRIDSNPLGDITLKLVNPIGQTIETRSVISAAINHTELFNISFLSKGIYYLIIASERYQSGEKIIVQ